MHTLLVLDVIEHILLYSSPKTAYSCRRVHPLWRDALDGSHDALLWKRIYLARCPAMRLVLHLLSEPVASVLLPEEWKCDGVNAMMFSQPQSTKRCVHIVAQMHSVLSNERIKMPTFIIRDVPVSVKTRDLFLFLVGKYVFDYSDHVDELTLADDSSAILVNGVGISYCDSAHRTLADVCRPGCVVAIACPRDRRTIQMMQELFLSGDRVSEVDVDNDGIVNVPFCVSSEVGMPSDDADVDND
eukprot:PhM_4_TR5945/c0_g1_i1/m.1094